MRLQETSCPSCRGPRSSVVYETRDWLRLEDPNSYRVVRCLDCELLYVNPRPCDDQLSSLYPSSYYALAADPGAQPSVRRVSEAKARIIERERRSGCLLDVGCQRGDFLSHMRERGWDVCGVELDAGIEVLPDLQIRFGTLAGAGYPLASFDVVTLWSVIEHMPDPAEQLAEAWRLLRPDGLLVLLTTNYTSIPSALLKLEDVPRHLVLFTKKTLGAMLRQQGFRVDRIECSAGISRNSARGALEYVAARARGGTAVERFYRSHFARGFSPEKGRQQRFQELRRTPPARSMLRAADRVVGAVLDRLSLWLGCYGTILAVARRSATPSGPASQPPRRPA